MANVLKRFIRQLDEPLLTENLKEGFLHAVNIEQVKIYTFDEHVLIDLLIRLMRNWKSTEIFSTNFL